MNKKMYLVIEANCDFAIYGAYFSLADAEEAIFTEAENFAYEVLMTEDPMDVKGEKTWNIPFDYKWLMTDCADCLTIHSVKVTKE